MTLAEVLRTRIKQLMAAKGLTIAELSAAAGMSKNWARNYLEEEHDLPLDRIEAVAKIFEVHPLDLLDVRALRPIAGLSVEDLEVARAFKSFPDETTKANVRRLLEIGERKRGRAKGDLQRGRTSSTGRDHAADFQQQDSEANAPKRRARAAR